MTENKAKRKKKWVCTNKSDNGLLKSVLLEGPAVVLVLTDAVTCSEPGYLRLAQGVWFVRGTITDRNSLSTRETGNHTQLGPEDAPFKVSLSPKDTKLKKYPAKNYRK